MKSCQKAFFLYTLIFFAFTQIHAQNFQFHKKLTGYDPYTHDVKFSPNGNYFALTAGDNTTELYDRNWKRIWRQKGDPIIGASRIIFSPDERYLVIGDYKREAEIVILDLDQRKIVQRFNGHKRFIYSLSFSADGKLLATGSRDRTVRIRKFDGDRFSEMQTIEIGFIVRSVALSPDGRILACSGDENEVQIWRNDGDQFQFQQTLNGHDHWVHNVLFSYDGRSLATGSLDNTIQIWRINGNELQKAKTLIGHQFLIRTIAFSHDGKYLASGSEDETIRIWNLNGDATWRSRTLKGNNSTINCVDFSSDDQFLACGSDDATVKIWQLKNLR